MTLPLHMVTNSATLPGTSGIQHQTTRNCRSASLMDFDELMEGIGGSEGPLRSATTHDDMTIRSCSWTECLQ